MEDKKSGFLSVLLRFIPLLPLLLIWGSALLPYLFEDLQLNPTDYARITDVDYTAVVVDEPNSQGKVVITERLTFDIHAASKYNPFWELWRDLPEDYVDGVKVDYKVNSVKQILPDGREVVYEKSPKLYWDDEDYTSSKYGPGKWYHSEGPYSESNAQYECVFFYVDGLYREKVVFEIEYEMRNAALRYNDCSDLYLALYSEGTIKYLNSFKAQILFPNKDMPSPGNYDVFTYGTNANDFPIEESADKNPGYYTFYFELDEEQLKFRPYNQYIEFDLVSYGDDKHIFTEYAPSNHYSLDNVLGEIYEEQQAYADTPGQYRVAKIIVFIILSIGAAFVLVYNYNADNRLKTKHYFFEPTVQMDYYRDIPSDLDPNFASTLVFCKDKPLKDNSGVYSAILLSLARKEYIEIKEWMNDDLQIIIKKPVASLTTAESLFAAQPIVPDLEYTLSKSNDNTDTDKTYEPLTPCEEYYFNLLLRHTVGSEILMSDFQYRVANDYENTESFAKNMQNSIVNIGITNGYFQKADYAQPKKQTQASAKALMVVGILLLTLVNIISYQTRMDLAFGAYFILGISCIVSSVYLKKKSRIYVLLTQFGEDEYTKWRGLYNFLNSDTLMNERTVIELPLWEKYLVYATAFGISEKVIQAISIRCPETSSSTVLNNNCYRSRSFHTHSSRGFHSSVRSGSSYSGGGFGYGGGGRGGGGGGGGH